MYRCRASSIRSALAWFPGRSLVFAAALGCVAIGQSPAAAQPIFPPGGAAAPAADQPPFTNQFQGEYFTTDLKEVFRLRHIEGDGQGDVDAYTNFGFTKFVWTDNGVLMLDVGARLTNETEPGVSAGIHRRVAVRNLMFGAGVFYDWDDFHQGSIALELFSPNWALRSNGYAILGDDVETDSEYEATAGTTIYFEGNNILADGLELHKDYEVAMSGVDFEVARRVGLRAAELFVGGYYYDGEIGGDTLGAKGGVRGFLAPDLSASLTVSDDDLFGTNVYGGITWFLGARGGLSRPNISRRLLIPVERNEQVVVNEIRRTFDVPDPVVLTQDDDAIEIVHIDSAAAAGGDGTFETPFDALPATQESDIVYVHAGSTFAGQSYTLAEDQRFLGEGDGNLHFVDTEELGTIVLPGSGNGGVGRPVIDGTIGNAIILVAQDNEVSNFRIQNVTGNAIFGDGVTSFDINRNIITNTMFDGVLDPAGLTTGRGIFLRNISGALDDSPVASGEVTGNDVSGSQGPNIEIVLAGDFEGEISGNVANGSINAEGIFIHGLFAFEGEVSDNTTDGNFTDGIVIEVDSFLGEIEDNIATTNGNAGLALTFASFDGDIEGNTASNNGDVGIDLRIEGDSFSEIELAWNTAEGNAAEGMHLVFAGRGTSRVEVLNNTFDNNNGGTAREFFAEVEDLPGNRPTVYIRLDGNTSTNSPALGSFNYEFDNNDLFADGEMLLDLGTNVGTVEDDEDVELAEFPW